MGTVLSYVVRQAIVDNGNIIFTVAVKVDGGVINFEAYFDKVNKYQSSGTVPTPYTPEFIQGMADYLFSTGDWVL